MNAVKKYQKGNIFVHVSFLRILKVTKCSQADENCIVVPYIYLPTISALILSLKFPIVPFLS